MQKYIFVLLTLALIYPQIFNYQQNINKSTKQSLTCTLEYQLKNDFSHDTFLIENCIQELKKKDTQELKEFTIQQITSKNKTLKEENFINIEELLKTLENYKQLETCNFHFDNHFQSQINPQDITKIISFINDLENLKNLSIKVNGQQKLEKGVEYSNLITSEILINSLETLTIDISSTNIQPQNIMEGISKAKNLKELNLHFNNLNLESEQDCKFDINQFEEMTKIQILRIYFNELNSQISLFHPQSFINSLENLKSKQNIHEFSIEFISTKINYDQIMLYVFIKDLINLKKLHFVQDSVKLEKVRADEDIFKDMKNLVTIETYNLAETYEKLQKVLENIPNPQIIQKLIIGQDGFINQDVFTYISPINKMQNLLYLKIFQVEPMNDITQVYETLSPLKNLEELIIECFPDATNNNQKSNGLVKAINKLKNLKKIDINIFNLSSDENSEFFDFVTHKQIESIKFNFYVNVKKNQEINQFESKIINLRKIDNIDLQFSFYQLLKNDLKIQNSKVIKSIQDIFNSKNQIQVSNFKLNLRYASFIPQDNLYLLPLEKITENLLINSMDFSLTINSNSRIKQKSGDETQEQQGHQVDSSYLNSFLTNLKDTENLTFKIPNLDNLNFINNIKQKTNLKNVNLDFSDSDIQDISVFTNFTQDLDNLLSFSLNLSKTKANNLKILPEIFVGAKYLQTIVFDFRKVKDIWSYNPVAYLFQNQQYKNLKNFTFFVYTESNSQDMLGSTDYSPFNTLLSDLYDTVENYQMGIESINPTPQLTKNSIGITQDLTYMKNKNMKLLIQDNKGIAVKCIDFNSKCNDCREKTGECTSCLYFKDGQKCDTCIEKTTFKQNDICQICNIKFDFCQECDKDNCQVCQENYRLQSIENEDKQNLKGSVQQECVYDPDYDDSMSTGTIVIIVLGSLVGVGIFGCVGFIYYKRKKTQQEEERVTLVESQYD